MHLHFTDRVASTSSFTPSTKTSSLARAFTTAGKNKDKDAAPMGRSTSQRAPVKASQISLPLALVSTTNMLSYDAPDLPGAPLSRVQKQPSPPAQNSHTAKSPVAPSVASTRSPSDADSLRSRHSNASTAATSLSVEGFGADAPEHNHLTCYFKPGSQAQSPSQASLNGSRTDSVLSHSSSAVSSPQIPSRAPSHNKQAHVLSHKRSVNRVVSPSSLANQQAVHKAPISTAMHPFGKELEQLNEIAEEYSSTVRDVEQSADNTILSSKGLGKFCAAEYMSEIAPLFNKAYGEDMTATVPTWI